MNEHHKQVNQRESRRHKSEGKRFNVQADFKGKETNKCHLELKYEESITQRRHG